MDGETAGEKGSLVPPPGALGGSALGGAPAPGVRREPKKYAVTDDYQLSKQVLGLGVNRQGTGVLPSALWPEVCPEGQKPKGGPVALHSRVPGKARVSLTKDCQHLGKKNTGGASWRFLDCQRPSVWLNRFQKSFRPAKCKRRFRLGLNVLRL
uniref:Uncharacterized protein n=1 Tax=Mus musculus TaxID=10090 RepID=Q8BVC2_MOUSE|nr:unnamed protein product [Mus musculus]